MLEEENGRISAEKSPRSHWIHIYLLEIYILTPIYFQRLYRDNRLLEALALFYIGFGLLISFFYFRLGQSSQTAIARISALTLIRLAITINTMSSFSTVLVRARREEIAGMGKDRIAFEPASVYAAKWLALNSIRLLFFIPFTAIVYPIIDFRGGFKHALIFFIILAIQQISAISVALLVSAIFTDPNIAAVVTSTIVLITFIFSGSIVPRSIVPAGLLWLEYLSVSFFTHQALLHNEFKGIILDDGERGEDLLERLDLRIMDIWPSIGAVIGYSAICIVLGMLALRLTSK